jgi:hypothetical protein
MKSETWTSATRQRAIFSPGPSLARFGVALRGPTGRRSPAWGDTPGTRHPSRRCTLKVCRRCRMSEPRCVLRGRVVDFQGKPVGGVTVGADTWRGRRPIRLHIFSAADGRLQWRSAPADVVLYDMGKQAYPRDARAVAGRPKDRPAPLSRWQQDRRESSTTLPRPALRIPVGRPRGSGSARTHCPAVRSRWSLGSPRTSTLAPPG